MSTKPAPVTTPSPYCGETYVVKESICYLMSHTVQAVRRLIDERMVEHDLTSAQWKPLWLLKTGACATPLELAKEMEMDAGALSRTLDRLEAKQLLRRARSLDDRRVVRLELTEAGHAVAKDIPYVLAAVNNDCLTGLSPSESKHLRGLLQRVLSNVTALVPPKDDTP